MSDSNKIAPIDTIQNQIFTIRSVQVMFDSDLAEIYGVETKYLNRSVSRNIDRFPEKFRFQLTKIEFEEYEKNLRFQFGTSENEEEILRSQIVISKEKRGGRRYLPFVFTEQGVSMLSAVLKSDIAIKISVQIMKAFIELRKNYSNNWNMLRRLNNIESRQISIENRFDEVLKAFKNSNNLPQQGIFFDGQVFDAFIFATDKCEIK